MSTITENHTDTCVSFTLKFAPEKLAEAEKVGILKVFKLECSISVQNMGTTVLAM